jgi:hypothetical protein
MSMSREFLDEELESWEVYASGGEYGRPVEPKIVFHCRSRPSLRGRYVRHPGDNAEAGALVARASDAELLEMLGRAMELG